MILFNYTPSEKSRKAMNFHADGFLQYELEASFMYEDTPDQHKATIDVKGIWKVLCLWIVGLWRCRFWKNRSCH